MNKNQKVTVLVDMYPTDSLEYDSPLLVQHVQDGSYGISKTTGTKRYRVEFELPKNLPEVEDTITEVEVKEE